MSADGTILVAIGDSLTENGTWPDVLCAQAGWSLHNAGRSGQTSTEVALRVGARAMDLIEGETSANGDVSVVPDPLPGPVREHVGADMDDIRVRGALDGRPGLLMHPVSAAAADEWTFRPDVPADATPRVRGRFRADPLPIPPGAVVVVWCGRNNPGPQVAEDVDAIVAGAASAACVLVLGVTAAAFEPTGSPGSEVVAALNAELARRHDERFVDVQAALLAAAPSADGVPAARLRSDDVHLSPEGDAVVADAIRARLVALDRWPRSSAT